MRKSRVYVESSVISYLTAWLSRDVIVRARQELTRTWWEQRERFELFISNTVLDEIGDGDPEAANIRLDVVQGIAVLNQTETVEQLTNALLWSGAVPEKSKFDAAHIAHAAVHEMDFLVTWNQKHIATDRKRRHIGAVISEFSFHLPQLLTPERHLIFEESTP